eukprot:COSAG06_NODE_7681_length_2414_cov_8.266091_2_plen_153_part_00
MEKKSIAQAGAADSTASNYKNPPPDRQDRQSSSCCSVRRLTWSRVVRAASRRLAFPPCILRNSPHRPPAAQSQRPRTARQCLPLAQRSRGRPHLQQKTPRRFWTCPVFVPSVFWELIVFEYNHGSNKKAFAVPRPAAIISTTPMPKCSFHIV